ncbi:hypothetical protein I553_9601 [Mycobacterium xenopi 4042]|uniref:Uncharacterized protein n=1 Tax=Mycobacterium xenopi 4042 TaxID=1299334 RepID=X8E0U0_MYCXE|nr:hypothetical protein I553_9601 [Mycobacterium xenopi 4042]
MVRSSRCSPSVDFADRSKDHAMTALYRATTRHRPYRLIHHALDATLTRSLSSPISQVPAPTSSGGHPDSPA